MSDHALEIEIVAAHIIESERAKKQLEAAAPDLLEALGSPDLSAIMEICEMFIDEYGDETMRGTYNMFAATRLAAIAKATQTETDQ